MLQSVDMPPLGGGVRGGLPSGGDVVGRGEGDPEPIVPGIAGLLDHLDQKPSWCSQGRLEDEPGIEGHVDGQQIRVDAHPGHLEGSPGSSWGPGVGSSVSKKSEAFACRISGSCMAAESTCIMM